MTNTILIGSIVRRFADHHERAKAFNWAALMKMKISGGDLALFHKAKAEGQREFSRFLVDLSCNTGDAGGNDQVSAYDLAAGELLKLRAEERARMAPRRVATAQAWLRKRLERQAKEDAKDLAALAS